FLLHEQSVKEFCMHSVFRSGLTIVREVFHPFENGGVTGCLVLSESHLSIHTWQELESVTLDIYACNFTKDNTDKARQVMNDFLALYQPQRSVVHDVPRDQQFLYEQMNPDYGFFVHSNLTLESRHTGFQSLEIHQTPQFGKLLSLDGYFMTSEKDEFVYHESMIHPAMCSQMQPRNVLIIGGGDGGAAEEVLKHPSGGCTEFCVNGLMAGNRRTFRSGYDPKHKESSTQRAD
ncbi:MAG: bifunctional adenosylmethionine decarboxylase/class I SAM-dependent methyltransferase, partial [Limnohabitans sp.]